MIDAALALLGLNKASAITGGVGALVAAMRGDSRPWWQRVINFTVGFFTAAYGAGIMISVFGLPDTPTFHGALGFTLGYLGMAIMDALLLAAEAVKKLDFKTLIEAFLKRIGIG